MVAVRVAWFVVLLVLTVGLVNPINSYATQTPDPIKWKLVFISSYPACSNYQYQMTNLYDSLAVHYMNLYNVDNEKYKPTCIPDKYYSKLGFNDKFNSQLGLPDDLNLLILVYDRNIGRAELNENGIGGFYHHVGTDKTKNNTIVLCDCPSFKFSEPTWILTHELSHFILHYKGFAPEIAEDLVHSKDLKYDYCVEVDHEDKDCTTIKTKLPLNDHAYSYNVMSLFVPTENSKPLTNTEKSLLNSTAFINVQKQITQWWALGKISDEDYAQVLGYTVGKTTPITLPTTSFDGRKMLFTTDPPKDFSNEIVSHDGQLALSDDQLNYLLRRVPLKPIYYDLNDITNELSGPFLPDWFKNNAMWWSEGQISNADYFKSIEFLLKK